MLEKKIDIDQIEVRPQTRQVQVRRRISILEDTVEVACNYERYTLDPGADLTDQPAVVTSIARAAWGV